MAGFFFLNIAPIKKLDYYELYLKGRLIPEIIKLNCKNKTLWKCNFYQIFWGRKWQNKSNLLDRYIMNYFSWFWSLKIKICLHLIIIIKQVKKKRKKAISLYKLILKPILKKQNYFKVRNKRKRKNNQNSQI